MKVQSDVKILNFGSLNLDYVYQVEHFVNPGETLSAREQTISVGGKGLNQSIALAKAGARVYHAGCIGAGGDRLLTALQDSGVDTTYIRRTDEIQGNAVIQVTPSGENCILLFGGSNQCVTREHIESALSAFSEGDYLLLQNEINELPFIVDMAYERKMKIVLNPSPYDDRLRDVDFGKLEWLLVNEIEAEQIAGSRDPKPVWEYLHAKYPKLSVVITLGGEGSIVYSQIGGDTEEARQPAIRSKVVDTTAAGDTYTGYLIAAVAEGKSISQSMRFAAAAASIAVSRSGAAASIPNRMETEALLAEIA